MQCVGPHICKCVEPQSTYDTFFSFFAYYQVFDLCSEIMSLVLISYI